MDSAELAQEAFGALARRDFDGFIELMHPDVEFTSLIAESEAKLFCGHHGVRQFLDQMLSVFPDFTPEVEWSESHGPVALSKVCFQGTGAGSGMEIEQTAWHVAWARDGKVIGWRLYRTEEEAREALTMAWENAAAAAREQPDSPRSRR
jgi:ketosteroid isomerase-like protein